MSTSNMEVFSEEFLKGVALDTERAVFLVNCETGKPTPNEKLAADYINKLKERVVELECANQNLHRICDTSAFNPTES